MSTVKANTIEPASGGTVTITGAALTTPALGTPASGTLTNCTGLPANTGLSGTTLASNVVNASVNAITPSGGTLAVTGGLTTTGNVGIGAAPSSNSIAKVLELESGFNVFGYAGLGYVNANSYFNGGWLYKNTAAAGRYEVGDVHKWFTAPSGTAGSAISFTQAMTLDTSGNLLVGTTSGSAHIIRKDVTADAGNYVLEVAGASGATIAAFYGVSSYGASSANAATKFGRDATTLRSINAGGTINASGADYAEYRKNNGLTIAKGQIVGYQSDGTLTLTWSEATMARVKSTDPCMVGGDTWGTEEKVGARPVEPKFTPPQYTGRAKPDDLAPEPQAPAPLKIITVAQQSLSSGRSINGGTINVNGSDYAEYEGGPSLTVLWEPVPPKDKADAVAAAVYALALRDFNAAKDAWEQADAAHAVKHAAWQELAEQHALAMEEWNTDQVEYKVRCDVERNLFDTAIYPEYLRAKAAFEERLEAARQTVDRIAYTGITPCNVQGATPGHYIVAAEGPNDTIVGLSVRRPTEEQWGWVVGRCLRVLPDGRAEIDVMLS